MIGLVLDDAGRKIVDAQLDAVPFPVQGADLDFPRARDATADIGDAQAPFPVFDDIAGDDRDLGIDDRERLRVVLAVLPVVQRCDEQAHALVHLRRGETHAAVLAHRVDHVVDQPLDRRALELGFLERTRFRAQHRMPHARDFQNGHVHRIILAPLKRCPTATRYVGRRFSDATADAVRRAPLQRCHDARPSDMSTLHPHDESHAYQFCPRCGGPLERRLLKSSEPERPVCTRCGFVFYLDPKIAVGTIIQTTNGRLVLVRRAIEPGYGKWVFPGGYVDRGEPLHVAALREAREECGLEVRLDALVNIYSYPGRAPVIVVYAASVVAGTLCVDDESLETAE